MDKNQALELLNNHVQNQNLRRHCLAVGAVMRALAEKLGGDADIWEVLGLVHDADWEETKDTPEMHTIETLAWLKEAGVFGGPLIHALESHNRKHTKLAELEGNMEWSLECCDELTGFIVAVTLVTPSKKLSDVTVESVLKKFPKKEFAKAVEREQIAQCEENLGIQLPEFVEISLKAMQNIAPELGL